MKKSAFLLIGLMYSVSAFSQNVDLDPSRLELRVYRFLVSTSQTCENPVEVFSNANPSYQDVLGSPNFGSGTLTNGTYPCIVIEFSDVIRYVPSSNSTAANCLTSTTYTSDVCNSESGLTGRSPDGSSFTCDDTEQRVTMWISTGSSAGNMGNAFTPPTSVGDTSRGIPLTNALVVSGDSSGTFVVNGTNKICDTSVAGCIGTIGSGCEMLQPTFSFSN